MKSVVTIGGGTGTFVVLSGLRTLPDLSLHAIVTMADDGGSTGRLRDAYGILPPGDARQALVALAENGTILRELFAYRFTKGDVAGHSLGNLLITALADVLGSDEQAFIEASNILRVNGTVIPATSKPAILKATLRDGTVIVGEKNISSVPEKSRERIQRIELETPISLSDKAKEAIEHADVIILGPGCLYSSTIAALLPDGMQEAIQKTKAKLLYITNLFTRAGETDGYTLQSHVDEVTTYAGREPDHIFVHNGEFSKEVLEWYAKENEFKLEDDLGDSPKIIRCSLASEHVVPPIENDPVRRSLLRHDSQKLAKALAPFLL